MSTGAAPATRRREGRTIDRVRGHLAARGWRPADLARRCGAASAALGYDDVKITAQRLTLWKQGQGEPSLRQAEVMARALGLPLECLAAPAPDVAAGDPGPPHM